MSSEISDSLNKVEKKISKIIVPDVSGLPDKIKKLEVEIENSKTNESEAVKNINAQIEELERQKKVLDEAQNEISRPYYEARCALNSTLRGFENAISYSANAKDELVALKTFAKVLEYLKDGWHILWVEGRADYSPKTYELGGGGSSNYQGRWKYIGLSANHLGFLLRSDLGARKFKKVCDAMGGMWSCLLVKDMPGVHTNVDKPLLRLEPEPKSRGTYNHPYYNRSSIGLRSEYGIKIGKYEDEHGSSITAIKVLVCPICKQGLRWAHIKPAEAKVYNYSGEAVLLHTFEVDGTKPTIDTPDLCECPVTFGITWAHDYSRTSVKALEISYDGNIKEVDYPA